MNPSGFIIAWIIGFGPVLYLGLWLGAKLTDFKMESAKKNGALEYRACIGCSTVYHKSWNGPGEEHLCQNCSGAT